MSADIERWDPPNDPTAFESLCLDLWRDIWQSNGQQSNAQKNGRRGYPQAGVDIFGTNCGKWIGVQCKQKDGLLRRKVTIPELNNEVAAAKAFRPALSLFILATTGPRDVALQQRARELTEQHEQEGLFEVQIWSWDDIWPELYKREELLDRIALLYWPRRASLSILRKREDGPRRRLLLTLVLILLILLFALGVSVRVKTHTMESSNAQSDIDNNRMPESYDNQGWDWTHSMSDWELPAQWRITSFGDQPALLINGPAWATGWPREFDRTVLRDFALRFTIHFPDADDTDGTKLLWLIRTQKSKLSEAGVDAVGGYQFSLIKQQNELYISGKILHPNQSQPALLDKPLKLGIHCCRRTTDYDVVVRAYQGHLDTCITQKGRTNLRTGRPDDPDSGIPHGAYFTDTTFSWGSFGFAAGDAARQVVLYKIDIINLQPRFKPGLLTDPSRQYYSEDFRCR